MDEDLPKIKSAPLAVVAVSLEGMSPDHWDEAGWRAFVSSLPAGSELILVDQQLNVSRFADRDTEPVQVEGGSKGLGPALRAAAMSAQAPLVVFLPADHSSPSDAVAALVESIDEVHIAIGCRRTGPIPATVACRDLAAMIASLIFLGSMPESRLGWPGWSGWGRRWVAKHIFGVPLSDPESNIVLARRASLERILLQSTGTFSFVELVAKANHLGCRLAEVGVDGQTYPARNFAADARRVFRNPDFDSGK